MRMQSGPTMFRATLDDLEQVFDGASVYVAYRTSRGFYPIKGGGKMGSQGFTELGHKAMGCQSKGGTDGSAGSGTSVGFVYSVFPELKEASETAANLEPEQAPSLIPVLKPRLRRFLQFAIPLQPKAILDSGASESIVRTNTLQQIYDQLRDMGLDADQEVKVDRSINMSFVFGHDRTGLAKVNAGICGLEKVLGVHVVDGSTPLLLSGKWLYDAGAVIDFRTGRAKFREVSDREVQLERAPSYHLMMPVTAFGGKEEVLRELFVPDESDEGPSQIFQTGPGPGPMRSP